MEEISLDRCHELVDKILEFEKQNRTTIEEILFIFGTRLIDIFLGADDPVTAFDEITNIWRNVVMERCLRSEDE